MARAKKQQGMLIHDAQQNELMNVRRIERDGNDLVIRGKIFGAMPMVAKLTPEEARKVLKVIDFKTLLFLATLPFRKSD